MGSPRALGRYEIVAEVGRGAMGAVYKARDPKIDRFVAIKTVLLHQSVVQEQQDFRRRFFIEAKAAGRLLHPGIVAVFDVGEDPETSDPYIVMEYIEGITLRELLASKGKKLPVDDALRIVQELAEALDYAHSQGVVHRDIKPANILVTKDGQAKISDFGIAQLDLTHMTLPGRVLGTPAYMSPEQLEGEQVDGRSDLFSLGAILYTSLTGHRPFQGNSATTVCFKVANREPLQATSLAPELPQELDAVIARALAKDPAERYQRGTEFAEDLRRLRERRPGRKATIWFSPPAQGQTRFDGKATPEGSSGMLSAKKARAPLHTAPRKDRSLGGMFSSWQVQTAIGIPLFVAALVVSLFAWREIHVRKAPARSIVENANPVSAVVSVQKATGGADAAVDSDSALQSETQTNRETEIASNATAAVAETAPKSKASHPGAGNAASSRPRRSPSGEIAKVDTSATGRTHVVPKTVTKVGAITNENKPAGKPNEVPSQTVVPAGSAAAVADSNVEIHIENRFSDATLKVWIDDKLAYAHPLHDGHKKRLMLLGGGTKETVTIPVSAGAHALRIEVRSASEQYDETKVVTGEFLSGGGRILSINFDKHSRDMRVTLGNE
jgi:eukaryotic-like serine/threonine-protein kinase